MGWDYTQGATKQEIIADLIKPSGNGARLTLSHSVRGNVLWTVETIRRNEKTERLIGCYLLGTSPGFGWGSKSMCESMHPYHYSCPLSYLDAVPEVACQEWRDGVRAYHKRNKRKLQAGDKVKLIQGVSYGGVSLDTVEVVTVRPLIVKLPDGQHASLKRKYIAAEEGV